MARQDAGLGPSFSSYSSIGVDMRIGHANPNPKSSNVKGDHTTCLVPHTGSSYVQPNDPGGRGGRRLADTSTPLCCTSSLRIPACTCTLIVSFQAKNAMPTGVNTDLDLDTAKLQVMIKRKGSLRLRAKCTRHKRSDYPETHRNCSCPETREVAFSSV